MSSVHAISSLALTLDRLMTSLVLQWFEMSRGIGRRSMQTSMIQSTSISFAQLSLCANPDLLIVTLLQGSQGLGSGVKGYRPLAFSR